MSSFLRQDKDVDGRVKPGHDDGTLAPRTTHLSVPATEIRPSFANRWSLREQRAQGMPGVRCTRSLVCKVKSIRVVTTGSPVHSGIPCAIGFNGFLRSLPGDRALLSPSPA